MRIWHLHAALSHLPGHPLCKKRSANKEVYRPIPSPVSTFHCFLAELENLQSHIPREDLRERRIHRGRQGEDLTRSDPTWQRGHFAERHIDRRCLRIVRGCHYLEFSILDVEWAAHAVKWSSRLRVATYEHKWSIWMSREEKALGKTRYSIQQMKNNNLI